MGQIFVPFLSVTHACVDKCRTRIIVLPAVQKVTNVLGVLATVVLRQHLEAPVIALGIASGPQRAPRAGFALFVDPSGRQVVGARMSRKFLPIARVGSEKQRNTIMNARNDQRCLSRTQANGAAAADAVADNDPLIHLSGRHLVNRFL